MTVDATAFLIRTHENNRQVQELVDGLKRKVSPHVFVVCDESLGTVKFSGTNKISLSPAVISKWSFDRHPEDWGWFCGDYSYYAAAEALPDFEYYCLIESDVHLSETGLAAVKDILQNDTSSALAADLRRHEKPPSFSKDLRAIGEDAHFGCIFPFTRVSRKLIPEMLSLRRSVQNHHSALRVNDEAILATAAHKKGDSVTDLYNYEGVFEKDSFATNPPFLQETLEKRPNDTRAFHPVVSTARVLDRLQSGKKRYSRHRLRRILWDAPDHVRSALSNALEQAENTTSEAPREQQAEAFERTERLACLINLLDSFAPIKVVDIGANPIEGEPSYENLLKHGQAQVVGFEPNKEAYGTLSKTQAPNEQFYCQAIGDGSAAKLYLTRHSGFTSLFRPDQRSAEYLGFKRPMRISSTEEFTTHRLDDLEFVPSIDILKIDIQGGELDVISNARDKLASALVIQTEVRFFPLYENEPTFGNLEHELREQGFLFHSFDFLKRVLVNPRLKKKLNRRAFSQVVDGDAFFVRDLRKLHTFTDVQLSKLCILADSVIGAFDVAGLCLEELAKRGKLSTDDTEKYFALLPDRVLR